MMAALNEYARLGMAIFFAVLSAYVIFTFLSGYLKYSGTRWQRAKLAFEGSATILWARFVMLVSFLGAFAVNAADYFNLPGVAEVMHEIFQPTVVLLITAGVSIISELARRRNGSGNPL